MTRFLHSAGILACLTQAGAAVLCAQRTAEQPLRIVGPGYTTATGALRVPVSREELQLQAMLVDAEGNARPLTGCSARWTSTDRSLEIIRVDEGGQSAWVVARTDGRPTVQVATSCARQAALLPAVIGRAGLEGEPPARPSNPEQAGYLPASIRLTPAMGRGADGTLQLTAGEPELQVIAEVRNGRDESVGSRDFPIAWTTSNAAVLAMRDDGDRSAYVTGKTSGTATLTVRAEGVTASLPVVVGTGGATVATAPAGSGPVAPATPDRLSAPPTPSDLTATATKVGEVRLRWTPTPGVTYEVHRGTSPQGPFSTVATGLTSVAGETALLYTSTKLYPAGVIYHQVVASSPTAAVTSESPVVATTVLPNAQPGNFQAMYHASNGTIRVSWQPVPGATGYMVTRSDNKPVNGNKLVRGAEVVDATPATMRLTYAVSPYFPVAPEFGLPTIEQGEMPGPAGNAPQAPVQIYSSIYRKGNTSIGANFSKVPGAKTTYFMQASSLSGNWTVIASTHPERGWLDYQNVPLDVEYAYRVQTDFPDGSMIWGTPRLLKLTPPPPGPVLNATSTNGSVTVSWAPVAGALDYNITRWHGTQTRQWLLHPSSPSLSVTENLPVGATVKFVVTVGYPSRDMSSKSEITVTVK